MNPQEMIAKIVDEMYTIRSCVLKVYREIGLSSISHTKELGELEYCIGTIDNCTIAILALEIKLKFEDKGSSL